MTGWQPVREFEGFYEVSEDGLVRTVAGRLCGQWPNQSGYMLVRLTQGSMQTRRLARVHRLVAEAFIPNPSRLPCVNHKDHDRQNNRATNLEWCTQADNLRHMHQSGRGAKFWKGKRSPNARLTGSDVAKVFELREAGMTWQQIAEVVGASKRTVGRILTREYYAT